MRDKQIRDKVILPVPDYCRTELMADEKNAPGRGGQWRAARCRKQLIDESMIHAAVPGALA
jgi:hypothetical protein